MTEHADTPKDYYFAPDSDKPPADTASFSRDDDYFLEAGADDDRDADAAAAADAEFDHTLSGRGLRDYYSKIGAHLSDEVFDSIAPVHLENLPCLPLAENLDPDELRARAILFANPVSIGYRYKAASNLTELAMATPDDAEAKDAFAISEELYASIMHDASPASTAAISGELSRDYVSVMRMRRAGDEVTAIAEKAYGILGQTLTTLEPYVEPIATGRSINSTYTGLLAEVSIAALLARAGRAPYMSSYREGHGARTGLSLASDLHLIEGKKIPVEVKYNRPGGSSAPYDESRIVLIKYFDVCRAVVKALSPDRPSKAARLGTVAVHISRLLAQEGTGNTLNAIDRGTVDEGTAAVARKIQNWQKRNSRRR